MAKFTEKDFTYGDIRFVRVMTCGGKQYYDVAFKNRRAHGVYKINGCDVVLPEHVQDYIDDHVRERVTDIQYIYRHFKG